MRQRITDSPNGCNLIDTAVGLSPLSTQGGHCFAESIQGLSKNQQPIGFGVAIMSVPIWGSEE